MATYLRLGPTTDLYDLLDETTVGHIYGVQGGIRTTQKKDDYWIEVYECVATGTHTAIVNYEEDIVDHLENAQLYVNDLHKDTVIWLYEYADNETAKRAAVLGGSLVPYSKSGTSRLMDLADTVFYMLTINRGPWEQTSAVTQVDAVSFAGGGLSDTNMSGIKGDIAGRISQFLVEATSTNDETVPLTKFFAGIRPVYGGYTSFDPVLDLEYAGTIENETTVDDIDDSNTYPSGSSADNVLLVTFADGVREKRATMSLKDAFSATTLVTNGDAETGDETGWTVSGIWTADASHKNSGSYGFYFTDSGASTETMVQQINVTPGLSYLVKYAYRIETKSATATLSVQTTFHDSGDGELTGVGRQFTTVSGSYTDIEYAMVAPTTASYVKFTITAAITLGDFDVAIDDIELFAMAFDHYRGEYTAIARAKLSGAGDVDIDAKFGYTSSSQLSPIGSPVSVTSTDWKLYPLGQVKFPPGRQLSDVDSVWRMGNLGFEIYAQRITGSINLYLDAILLVPSRHSIYIDGCSICRSSYTIGLTDYAYANLDIRTTEVDEIEVLAEAEDFLGINTDITYSVVGWELPNEESVLVVFAERSTVHGLTDIFDITLKYVPRYNTRNTD